MYDDYTYRALSYRLSKFMNQSSDHRVYIAKELKSLSAPDWIDYYIRISYVQNINSKPYKQCELFNYWDKAFIGICDYLVRFKYSFNCYFIREDMSLEELDLQLAIRGY